MKKIEGRFLFSSHPTPSVQLALRACFRKAPAEPRREAIKGNGQHLVHFNFIKEIPLKMNDRIKFKFAPSAI